MDKSQDWLLKNTCTKLCQMILTSIWQKQLIWIFFFLIFLTARRKNNIWLNFDRATSRAFKTNFKFSKRNVQRLWFEFLDFPNTFWAIEASKWEIVKSLVSLSPLSTALLCNYTNCVLLCVCLLNSSTGRHKCHFLSFHGGSCKVISIANPIH